MKDITRRKLIQHYLESTELKEIFKMDVIQHCRVFDYSQGEMVCESGMDFKYLLFMVEGGAKVFTMLDNGKIYLLRIEHPMMVYGEMEVMMADTYNANVEALNGCRCLAIPVTYIRKNCLESPEFLTYVIRSLSLRLDKISNMSTTNLLLPLKNKFASYLRAHTYRGEAYIDSSFLNVADHLGTTYRHLSRTMAELEEEGVYERRGKHFVILDEALLEETAGNAYRY